MIDLSSSFHHKYGNLQDQQIPISKILYAYVIISEAKLEHIKL